MTDLGSLRDLLLSGTKEPEDGYEDNLLFVITASMHPELYVRVGQKFYQRRHLYKGLGEATELETNADVYFRVTGEKPPP